MKISVESPGHAMTTKQSKITLAYLPRLGLLCGCKKVKELVPSVRLARFHNESLPSLLPFLGAGEEGEVPSDRFD